MINVEIRRQIERKAVMQSYSRWLRSHNLHYAGWQQRAKICRSHLGSLTITHYENLSMLLEFT
jgi:hypothetical protein